MLKIKKSIIALMICLMSTIMIQARDFTVVIDAGHGGHDYGALGLFTNEKSINLGVALKLERLIKENQTEVNVVMTRNTDVFVTLEGRAEIANHAHGDLFISIHTNSVDKKSKNRKTVHGAATYTLGTHKNETNLSVAMRENSVISLENDYNTTYQGFDPNSTESYIIFEISQNKHVEQSLDFAANVQCEMVSIANRKDNGVRQAGFWVLARTSMPAVLVELDFICNPDQEKFLGSEKGQEKLATAIYNAFVRYKNGGDESGLIKVEELKGEEPIDDDTDNLDNRQVVEPSPATPLPNKKELSVKKTNEPSTSNKITGRNYRIQILSSSSKLPENSPRFQGLKPVTYYEDNGLYKYTFGTTNDKKEILTLLPEVRKKFKDAFVVEFEGDKRVGMVK